LGFAKFSLDTFFSFWEFFIYDWASVVVERSGNYIVLLPGGFINSGIITHDKQRLIGF